MTIDWTPREQQLWAALETLVGHIKPEEVVAYRELARDDGKPRRYPLTVTDHAIITGCAALSTPPPPDPRDEALRQIADIGGNLPDERLTSSTGPMDAVARGLMYIQARTIALAAIASVKGGSDGTT